MSAPAEVGPAWEHRSTTRFWLALWQTWRDSVFRPLPFFRSLPPSGGYGSALSYAVLMTGIGLFFSLYWGVLARLVGGAFGEVEAAVLLLTAIVALALLLALYIGGLFLSAAVIHIALLAAGAGRQGFEATFRALAYSSGPGAFALFPFFGPLIGWVWGLVLAYIGVREVQRTTSGRALIGFLVPVVVALLLLLAFAALLTALMGRRAPAIV